MAIDDNSARGSMARGVTCTHCGANTALPDDLRIATFACGYCQRELSTAAYAGSAAVAADQLTAYVKDAVHGNVANAPPPAYREKVDRTEEAPCKRCGQTLAVPMDLHKNHVECPHCHAVQPITDYVSQGARVAIDMRRQIEGNEALAKLRAEGVPCHACGAKNKVPDDGSVQVRCEFCGATILLSDHVPQDAIARSRLKQGMMEMRAEIAQAKKAQDRRALVITLVVFAVAAVVVAVLASGVLR